MIATFALLIQTASSLPSDASALESSISALESCISALESRAETLNNSSASLEPWTWVFTALVVVGVAMEFWVIRHVHREDMETWALTFFGVNRTVRPPTGRLVVEYLSVALVAGGIVGELAMGVMISSINAQLRGVGIQLRSKNAELRTASDQLVALLESENLRLGALVNPRRLTITQQLAITENCSKFKNLFAGKRIKLVSYWLDTESLILDLQIANSLRMKPCEMSVDDEGMSISPGLGTFSWGISIFGSDSELAKKIADAISRNGGPITAGFLKSDPIANAPRFETANSRLPHEVTVLIGPKMLDPDTVKEMNRITPAANPISPSRSTPNTKP